MRQQPRTTRAKARSCESRLVLLLASSICRAPSLSSRSSLLSCFRLACSDLGVMLLHEACCTARGAVVWLVHMQPSVNGSSNSSHAYQPIVAEQERADHEGYHIDAEVLHQTRRLSVSLCTPAAWTLLEVCWLFATCSSSKGRPLPCVALKALRSGTRVRNEPRPADAEKKPYRISRTDLCTTCVRTLRTRRYVSPVLAGLHSPEGGLHLASELCRVSLVQPGSQQS